MNDIDRARTYLTLPPAYALKLGGLRWSERCDAIEWPDDSTLALGAELHAVLEGVFTGPRGVAFAYVLHILQRMKDGGPAAGKLRGVYASVRGQSTHRNAGLLIAELCRDVPAVVGAVRWPAVSALLNDPHLNGEKLGPIRAEEPPLSHAEFEHYFVKRLAAIDERTLRHWLIHGCAPGDAGKKLAAQVESLSARAARLLRHVRQRERLVGAAALVPALDAAFTLPPRRRSDALPQGGYSDVTTRGDPERLLPGQFALDPDEFVRRFAERELLYFLREEPNVSEKPERVILLDQGVRTWGGVRLGLAGAALTLLQKDAKCVAAVRLAVTSQNISLDVCEVDDDALAARLEASDLTASPAACLKREVDAPAGSPRDLVLLTHPRNLQESEVLAAVGGLRAGDRLFALSVDGHGRAELSEWKTGGRVAVRSFRVNLDAADAARVESPPPRSIGPSHSWTGNVEPIGFPFRPGLIGETLAMGFDAEGEWLVTAGRDGILHGLTLDGSPPELLSRAFQNGAVLKQVEAIVGVIGGVVVFGRMWLKRTTIDSTDENLGSSLTTTGPSGRVRDDTTAVFPALAELAGEFVVAAHYDRGARTVALHVIGALPHKLQYSAFPDLHCVVARGEREAGCALDLATLGRVPGSIDTGLVSRARLAWERAGVSGAEPKSLQVVAHDHAAGSVSLGRPFLHIKQNAVQVSYVLPHWKCFEPQRDGKPLLAGTNIQRAILAENVLALAVSRQRERQLLLFRGPDGVGLGELPYDIGHGAFTLSPDGKRLARRDARELVVSDTASPALVLTQVGHAGLHTWLDVRFDAEPFRLAIRVGTFEHVFTLEGDVLQHTLHRSEMSYEVQGSRRSTASVEYDAARFPCDWADAFGRLRVLFDRLGQVVLLKEHAVVACFIVRRERKGVWIPGDVLWGDPVLIGGAPTPAALRTIGLAIAIAGRVS